MKLTALTFLLLGFVVMTPGSVLAAMDQTIRVSAYCTEHFARAERQYGIPKHLLMAIASTESGRWSDTGKTVVPWPWTINAEGKGQYFNTKHEAVSAVRRLQAKGVASIDTGCMQVNLKHHPKAFSSVTQAFDPMRNVDYAARFLQQNYRETKSWRRAVAAYHSKTQLKGHKYYTQVKKNWKRVLAQAGSGLHEMVPYLSKAGQTRTQLASLDIPEEETRIPPARAQHRIPRMKVIRVTETPVADNGPEVLIIRPKPNLDSPIVVASNLSPETAPKGNVQVIRGERGKDTLQGDSRRVSDRKTGPNFIFY